MTNSIELFKKEYDGESLYDLDRDISEALLEEYNPLVGQVPTDKYGIPLGRFTVEIKWEPVL